MLYPVAPDESPINVLYVLKPVVFVRTKKKVTFVACSDGIDHREWFTLSVMVDISSYDG